jgi:exopolyphosphatase/guanosine-5'-triphosphate,3'-diphosphate pyrophosphatase
VSANDELGAPARVGVVDIGSTTATLALYRGGPFGFIDRFEQVGEALHLMRALGSDGALPKSTIQRTVWTLQSFARHAAAAGVSRIHGVATSAVRDAVNREELLTAIRSQSGIPVEILDGDAEARAGARSALETLPLTDGLVVDLGGGSVQLARVVGRRVRAVVSLPLGSARTSAAYLRSDPPRAPELTSLRRRVEELVRPIEWARGVASVVGIGGTIRCLAKVDRKARRWPLDHGHGYSLTLDVVMALVDSLSRMRAEERAGVPGMASHRIGTIDGGALTLSTILRLAGADEVMVSTYGLREGIAMPMLHGPTLTPDVRNAGLAGRFPDPSGKAVRAAAAAGRAFDLLAERAHLDPGLRPVVTGAVRVALSGRDPARLLDEPLIGHPQQEVLAMAALLGLVPGELPATLRAIYDEQARAPR